MAAWKTIKIHNGTEDSSHERKYLAYFATPQVESESGAGALQSAFFTVELSDQHEKQFKISSELFGFVGKYVNDKASGLRPGASVETNCFYPIRLGDRAGNGSQLLVELLTHQRNPVPSITLSGQKAGKGSFQITCGATFLPSNGYVVGLGRKIKCDYESKVAVAVIPCQGRNTYTITPVEEIYVSRYDGDDISENTILPAQTNACSIKLNDIEKEAVVNETGDGFLLNGRPVFKHPPSQSSTKKSKPANAAPYEPYNWTFTKDTDEMPKIEDKWDTSRIREWDIVFVIDNTNSMSAPAKKGGKETRWQMVCSAMSYVAELAAREDEDGVDIHFLLDHTLSKSNVKTGREILEVLNKVELNKYGGRTYFEPVLAKILSRYLRRLERSQDGISKEEVKPLDLIILTDGEANDKRETTDRLARTARKLDQLDIGHRQLGIQFVQVGDDVAASKYLKNLGEQITKKYSRNVCIHNLCLHSSKSNLLIGRP